MPRYIDAELFSKNLTMQVYLADDEDFTKAFVKGMELVKKAEEETPTADVEEVRHGKWTIRHEGTYKRAKCYCSVCGKSNGIGGIISNQKKQYCPNCGAKMDLEDNKGRTINE